MPSPCKKISLVFAVSRDVCRTALKERMMYGFLLLAFLFILMANVPFMVNDPDVFGGSLAQEAAIQIGFVSINIFTLLIAVFASLSTLQTYLSKERLILLLSKPLEYWQIFEGVVFGLFQMLFLNWFLMTAGIWLVYISQTRTLGLFIWSGMSVTLLLALIYCTLVVFFYCLIPNLMAGILSVLVIIAGFGTSLARETFSVASYHSVVKKLLELGLNVLPKINELMGISLKELSLFNIHISGLWIIVHSALFLAVLNLVSILRFRKFCQF